MASSPTSRQPRPYPSGYPRWLNKALAMAVVFVMLGITVWRALGQLTNVLTILLGAWFLSLAMEPMVRWFVRHRVRRTRATGLTMLIFGLSVIAVLAVFGQLFVSQMTQFIKALPGYYDDLAELVDKRFNAELPDQGELFQRALDQWGQNVAGSVITITSSVLGALFTGSAVLLVAYYMTSAGPKFRAAVCKYMAPQRQHEVLHIWEVSQEKVSDFITSRLILAAISSVATFITLTILHVPYALPLAAFTGIVSQFVPTIGTYIGGALPVLLALTLSPGKALIVVIFIVAYQQVENYILSPRVSEKSMALNPAVAFVSVLAFGALFGALGAFLALPVTATIQAVSTTFIRRHALVESEMLNDGEPGAGRKSDATAPTDGGTTSGGGSGDTPVTTTVAPDGA